MIINNNQLIKYVNNLLIKLINYYKLLNLRSYNSSKLNLINKLFL
jgi:hypothetical protein